MRGNQIINIFTTFNWLSLHDDRAIKIIIVFIFE